MKLKGKNFNLFALAWIDITRQKLWVSLKILVLLIWDLLFLNFLLITFLNNKFFTQPYFKTTTLLLFGILTFIVFIFLLLSISLSSYIKRTEFGLLRAIGATRINIFMLILNESLILTILSGLLLLVCEIFLISYFRLELSWILKSGYNLHFFLILLKSIILVVLTKFIFLFLLCFPVSLKYSFSDTYTILRY